ncbi:MAG TPA: RidA family protein [Tepidisphaeraceae bacterium]|nr:RidA family protein [Tepidisphaeraceae bacterium]
MTVTEKLAALGITIPAMTVPLGAYVRAKRSGNLLFVAGQLPMKDGKLTSSGAVPSPVSVDKAADAARQCAVNAIAAAGSVVPIDSLAGVLRVAVFVQSADGLADQPKVANGASEFLLDVFGESGRHVRTAVGVNALPMDATVEVEVIFELASQSD